MARKRLSQFKNKSISRKEFFKKISSMANYADPELSERVYYAMIKVCTQELRATGAINLPDLMLIRKELSKPRKMCMVGTGIMRVLKPYYKLTCIIDQKLKSYFSNLQVDENSLNNNND